MPLRVPSRLYSSTAARAVYAAAMPTLDYRDGHEDDDRLFAAFVTGVYWLSACVLVLVTLLLTFALVVAIDVHNAVDDRPPVMTFGGLLALAAVALTINLKVLKRHHRRPATVSAPG